MTDEVDKLANNLDNISVGNAVKTTFRWKVDVPEFVPRSSVLAAAAVAPSTATTTTTSTTHENSVEHSASSKSYADVAKKRNNNVLPIGSGATNAGTGDESYNAGVAEPLGETASFVNGLLNDLHNDPEDVDNICGTLMEYLNNHVFDDATLTAAINCVLEAALSVENFAYLCTRVLMFMHDGFVPTAENISFRNCLLSCLETEHKNSAALIKDSALSSRVRSFAYVLSELSVNVMLDGRPITVLAKALYQLLDVIISEATDENVRYAINVLKSTGAHLESVEKTETKGSTPLMNALIDRLECIGTTPNSGLSENTKFIIRNLRGVRRHWAYTSPSTPSLDDQNVAGGGGAGAATSMPVPAPYETSVQVPPSVVIEPSAYYFVPESLSAEERAFYEQQCRAAGVQISLSDNDNTTCSEDDAIADAYEEFLSSVQRR